MNRAASPGPSEETLRQFGITPEERQRNREESDRQLDTLIDVAREAFAAEPEAPASVPVPQHAASAAQEVDELELAERFANESALLAKQREARDLLRSAIRRYSPREEPGEA
jgi:hypothetical protein